MKRKVKSAIELLGLPAKDKVTGFSGVLTSVSYDLYGCIQFVITPDAKDGKFGESAWIDANRIKVTEGERVMELPKFNENYVLEYGKGAAEKPLP